jgi:hypothetical protein
LIDWNTLTTNGRPLVPPKLNRRRALFMLGKIDEILAWEQGMERERDTRFVELRRYLCEVRPAGQPRGWCSMDLLRNNWGIRLPVYPSCWPFGL